MGGKHTGANYDLAKAEADKVDAQIIETLKTGHSFRVEAGAGSGKTYSLNRVIEWIQSNKWSDYSRKKQNVVCITYTNAAVAQYSTEHGVKGEEYDNVIFVISKGWNQYQFETYAPMITKKAVIPSGKQASFERNRNLFYVCCSRPKKRLIFFVTVPIDSTFKSFLVELVGEQNIFTFSQYIERKSIK